jgi:ankyrin repeat protein
VDAVKLLLNPALGKDILQWQLTDLNKDKLTPLHLAIENGRMDVVGLLLNPNIGPDVLRKQLEAIGKDYLPPLCFAIKHGCMNAVKLLLNSTLTDLVRAQLEQEGIAGGYTVPLDFAIKHAKTEIVPELLGALKRVGAGPDLLKEQLVRRNGDGLTPLYLAVKKNCTAVVKLLLDQRLISKELIQAQLMAVGDIGLAPLRYAVDANETSLINMLLDSIEKEQVKNLLFAVDRDGMIILLRLIRDGNNDAVKALLRHPTAVPVIQAQLALKDNEGRTLFWRMIDKVRTDEYFTKAWASLSQKQSEKPPFGTLDGWKARERQEISAKVDTFSILWESLPGEQQQQQLTCVDKDGWTMLGYAIWQNNVGILRLLLKHMSEEQIRDQLIGGRDVRIGLVLHAIGHGYGGDGGSFESNDAILELLRDAKAVKMVEWQLEKTSAGRDQTILGCAIEEGNVEVVNALLRLHKNVIQKQLDYVDRASWSILHEAVEHNRVNSVLALRKAVSMEQFQKLLMQGVEPSHGHPYGSLSHWTMMHRLIGDDRRCNMAKALLISPGDLSRFQKKQQDEIIKKQAEFLHVKDNGGHTALQLALQYASMGMVRLLLDMDNSFPAYRMIDQLTSVDGNQRTPLHLVAMYGKVEVVKFLLEHPTVKGKTKAQLEAEDKYGHTPLRLAILEGKIGVVEELQRRMDEKLFKAQLGAVNKDHQTLMHLAMMNGDVEIVKLLLSNPSFGGQLRAQLTAKDRYGHTPLQQWAIYGKYGKASKGVLELLPPGQVVEQVKELIEPLVLVAKYGTARIVRDLLESVSEGQVRAWLPSGRYDAKSLLREVADADQADVFEELLQNSKTKPIIQEQLKANDCGDLSMLAMHGDRSWVVRALLNFFQGGEKTTYLTTPDKHGWVPIILAVISFKMDVMKVLLSRDLVSEDQKMAQLMAKDERGRPLLHVIMECNFNPQETVRLLLKLSQDPQKTLEAQLEAGFLKIVDSNGLPPLHFAIANRLGRGPEIVDALLDPTLTSQSQRMAQLRARNRERKTALQFAVEESDAATVQKLLNFMERAMHAEAILAQLRDIDFDAVARRGNDRIFVALTACRDRLTPRSEDESRRSRGRRM